MKKITHYQIVDGNNTGIMQDRVNDEISRGWQPFGNFMIIPNPGTGLPGAIKALQPMVKYED